MKIGFFGDSFCEEMWNQHSVWYGYKTYLRMVKDHYQADIVNLGQGGSSVWDTVLLQFPKFENNLPDVCIFCWTDSLRLYHPKVRNICYGTVVDQKKINHQISGFFNRNLFSAAESYFKNLYFPEKAELETKALLHYFDDFVLSKIEGKTKILHFWSFDPVYDWKHGKEIKEPLVSIANQPNEHDNVDISPNHFGDHKKNQQMFELIKANLD